MAYGIMFHHFHDQKHPQGQGSISAAQFEKMILTLGRENILNADEWIAKSSTNSIKDNQYCITFDDNLLCQYDVALPVLNKYNIKAFWFVYTSIYEGHAEKLEVYRHFRSTQFASIEEFYKKFFAFLDKSEFKDEVAQALSQFDHKEYLKDFPFYSIEDKNFRFTRDKVLGVEKYNKAMDQMIAQSGYDIDKFSQELWMSEKNLKELSDTGHIVGLHSHSHPTVLCALDMESQNKQYETNFKFIQSITGKKPIAMSHPCNSYNEDTIDILKDLQIQIGFRANLAAPLYKNQNNFEYPREDHANLIKKLGIS